MSFAPRVWLVRACVLAGLSGLCACGGGGTSEPIAVDGWDTYGYVAHVMCGARPVLLHGSRTDVTLDGPCARVMVAGDHNDVSVALIPGGTIDITGDHNDVTWHMPAGHPGAPSLLDHGQSNTYHAGD
jgi:hypothetical protein